MIVESTATLNKMANNSNIPDISRINSFIAEDFISCKEDQLNMPTRYYTLTPSNNKKYPAEEGWEDVTYYTNRSKNIKIPKGLVGSQYIYILTNKAMPGLCKIGFTKSKPTERVKQINSATGVAIDFDVCYQFPCFNAHDLEGEIHSYLEYHGFRVNKKKEFFNISVKEAVSVVERIGEPYRMQEQP